MVRLNPDIYSTLLTGIEQNKQLSDQLLQELSSGRRVNAYADDPAAAASLVYNRAQVAQDDTYNSNLADLKTVVQTGDSAIGSVVTSLTQAISLGVEGANGTLSDSDRQAIAAQVNGIQQQLLSLANTSIAGHYVFAGTNVTAPAYVADNTSPSGVKYQGNTTVNTVELQQGRTTASNVPGSQIFSNAAGDVFQSIHDLSTALTSNGDISGAVSSVRKALDVINQQRVFYGQTLNQIDAASTNIAQDKLQLQQQETSLAGADTAKVATDLSQVELAQNALYAAAGKISQQNLFDYLK